MKSNAWVRIIGLILPYIIIIGLSQFFGYHLAQVPLDKPDYVLSTWQQLIISFFTFLGTTLLIWLFMKYVDKEKFSSTGLELTNRWPDIWFGIGLGLGIMVLAIFSFIISGQITFYKMTFDILELIYILLIFVFVAISEELLFRGYILKNLMQSFNKYLALFISAIIFSLMHGMNPNISTFNLFGLFTAGLALGATYIYTQNLWFPISFHFSWNFFQSLLGFNVSGRDIYSLLEIKIPNANISNGGQFGFEGSVFAPIIELILVFSVVYYYKKKKAIQYSDK